MNNEKIAQYLSTIGSIYYAAVGAAKTETGKAARRKNGVLFKKAATAVSKETAPVAFMTREELTAIKDVGEAMADTILTLGPDGEDRKPLTNILNEYVKEYPAAQKYLDCRETTTTGRSKLYNLQEMLAVSEGKTLFDKVLTVYTLSMAAETMNFLEKKEGLAAVHDVLEKIITSEKTDFFTSDFLTKEELSTVNEAMRTNQNLQNYLTLEKGLPTRIIRLAAELYVAYNEVDPADYEGLVGADEEYLELEDAIGVLGSVDSSPLVALLQEIKEKTAEEYFELYEAREEEPEDVTVETPAPEKKEEKAPAKSKKEPVKDSKQSYREQIVTLLESMATGYAAANRLRVAELYADVAARIAGRVDKKFGFNNVNELKQIVYRKTLLAPVEITDFIERWEKGKLSDDEKKILLRGEKQYSERKEKEVVGNTPITKEEIIAFVNSLAEKESRSGSAEAARIYREIVTRLGKAKASINSAKEGYEVIWYGKPLLPLDVALLVEEYAAKQKSKPTTSTFDFRTLLTKKGRDLYTKEDITVAVFADQENDLSEDDRLVLYWGPALAASNFEQLKIILRACALKGSVGASEGIAYWKPAPINPLEEALAGPLRYFSRGRFEANNKTYLILQIDGTQQPFLVEIRV